MKAELKKRNRKSSSKKPRHKERGWIIFFDLLLIAFFLFFALRLINAATENYKKSAFDKVISDIEQSLLNTKTYALNEARQIAKLVQDKNFLAMLEKPRNKPDINAIISELNSERQKLGLQILTLVDREGRIAVQTDEPLAEGRYLFETSEYGALMAAGQEGALYDVDYNYSLLIIGETPIIKDGRVEGGVAAGYALNNDFSDAFKKQTLPPGAHIAFYSLDAGITGSSFKETTIRNHILAIFNTGNTASEWFRNYRENQKYFISVAGGKYAVRNLEFHGSKGSLGGALVFIPYSYAPEGMGAFLAALFIFLGAAIYLHLRHRENWKNYGLLLCLTLIAFFAVFEINKTFIRSQYEEIIRPELVIYNSTLELAPAYGIFGVGSSQYIDVIFSSGGEAVNAVRVVLKYDPAALEVTSINIDKTLCDKDLFMDKQIDREKGQVLLSCGKRGPGFSEINGMVARLFIKPLAPGNLSVTFTKDSAIFANDGLATNVLRLSTGASYSAIQRTAAEDAASGSLLLFSKTHPNSEMWYAKRDVNFSWLGSPNGEYSYLFDTSTDSKPHGENMTTSTSVTLSAFADNIYYFHIRQKLNKEYGPISHFKVKIDTAPPDLPKLRLDRTEIQPGEIVRAEFNGSDTLSGLQRSLYLKVDDSAFFPIVSPVMIPFEKTGEHLITVRAFDLAGNISDASAKIFVRGTSPIKTFTQSIKDFLF